MPQVDTRAPGHASESRVLEDLLGAVTAIGGGGGKGDDAGQLAAHHRPGDPRAVAEASVQGDRDHDDRGAGAAADVRIPEARPDTLEKPSTRDLAEAPSGSSEVEALRLKAQLEERSIAEALKRDAARSEATKPLKIIARAEGAVEKEPLAPDAEVLKKKLSWQASGFSAITPQPPTALAPARDAKADGAMQPSGKSNRQSDPDLAELQARLAAHDSPLVRIGRVLYAKRHEAAAVILACLLGAATGTAISLMFN